VFQRKLEAENIKSQREESIMKQALIYVRCASPNDHAIQCQQRACKAFAEEHGYNVSEIIVERGVAGRVSQRVSLDLLLKLAGQRRFDALILHSGSRISRNAPEAFSFLDAVALCDVEIWSVKEGNYTDWRAAYVDKMRQIISDYLRETEDAFEDEAGTDE
jgi:DNA invertase Pin-like site-specific DNA recombinase